MNIHVITPARFYPAASSLSEMFGKRLDLWLPTLASDDDRRRFLLEQRIKFENSYGRFLSAGRVKFDPTYGLVSEFDFALTICEIDARLRALAGSEAARC